jgi:hypothetical protein
MGPKEGSTKLVVQRLFRVVIAHRDLLEDHAALQIDICGIESGVAQHVADQVDGEIKITVQHMCVKAGVLLGGERVELTADHVDLLGDRRCRASRGAFEQ